MKHPTRAGIAQPHVIALTASAVAGDRERFLRAGMNDYLSKPVRPAELQRALAQVAAGGTAVPAFTVAGVEPRVDHELLQWATLEAMVESLGLERTEGLASVLQLFEEALPPQLDAIDEALARGDVARAQHEAHRLRGGCLQLGAWAMAGLCQRIEHGDNLTALQTLTVCARTCYGETYALLRTHVLSGSVE